MATPILRPEFLHYNAGKIVESELQKHDNIQITRWVRQRLQKFVEHMKMLEALPPQYCVAYQIALRKKNLVEIGVVKLQHVPDNIRIGTAMIIKEMGTDITGAREFAVREAKKVAKHKGYQARTNPNNWRPNTQL